MRFLLDTDTVSYALRGHGDVANRITQKTPEELGISSITLAELRIGAERKGSKRIHSLISNFISSVKVLPFDGDAADEFGRVGALLTKKGTPIGHVDMFIAAHAISLRCVLVTNNVKHFSRVPGLMIENWT